MSHDKFELGKKTCDKTRRGEKKIKRLRINTINLHAFGGRNTNQEKQKY